MDTYKSFLLSHHAAATVMFPPRPKLGLEKKGSSGRCLGFADYCFFLQGFFSACKHTKPVQSFGKLGERGSVPLGLGMITYKFFT